MTHLCRRRHNCLTQRILVRVPRLAAQGRGQAPSCYDRARLRDLELDGRPDGPRVPTQTNPKPMCDPSVRNIRIHVGPASSTACCSSVLELDAALNMLAPASQSKNMQAHALKHACGVIKHRPEAHLDKRAGHIKCVQHVHASVGNAKARQGKEHEERSAWPPTES